MVDGLCAIQILQRPFAGGGLYDRGAYSEGGAYMPINTVRVARDYIEIPASQVDCERCFSGRRDLFIGNWTLFNQC